tara:strand:+ start:928 stop:1845 length:918 start_codon:yes stop_codon:yes gene_type:complete
MNEPETITVPVSDMKDARAELEHYDYTALSSYTCLQKGYFQTERHLQSPEQGEGLLFGIDLHAALAVFYRGIQNGDDKEQTHLACARKFAQSYEKHPEFPRRNLKLGLEILAEYFLHFASDWDLEIVKVEQPFSILFTDMPDGLPFLLEGKRDLGFLDEYGRSSLMDHKTAWRIDSTWRKCPQFQQYRGYMWAEWKATGVAPELIYANGIATLSRGGGEKSFYRAPTDTFSEDMMRDFELDVAHKVLHIRMCRTLGHWPKNDQVCKMWNRACDYLPVCKSPTTLRENALRRFEHRVWDPLETGDD